MTDTEAQPADPSASQPTPAPIGAGPVSELPEDALEAAAKAEYEADGSVAGTPWEEIGENLRAQYTEPMARALAAALPFLERATRAKIADEIERTLWNFEEPFTRLPAMAAAARVARGGEATE